nr:hypothetical protein [Tanacetum cinerariifolium]
MSYLTDYEEINEGYVAFGGNPKGGKIIGKGTIRAGNMSYLTDYEEINEGYVAFGGNLKGGKNIGKGTIRAVVNVVQGKIVNAVNASTCLVWKPKTKGNPQMDLHDKGVINSGCSRHMTRNMSYLTDYEEITKGYVAYG